MKNQKISSKKNKIEILNQKAKMNKVLKESHAQLEAAVSKHQDDRISMHALIAKHKLEADEHR